jgi:general L-amino acid transport system substrate-binding protein
MSSEDGRNEHMKSLKIAGLAALVAVGGATGVLAQGKGIDAIKARGTLSCGVSPATPGYSNPDDKGNWVGFDVDYCRALAVAIFNDPNKVTYKPLTSKERFTALQSGEVDLLSRTTTWTMSRDSSMGLSFAGTMFYDGQGFMVKKSLGVKAAKELNGASVCVQTGTTTELNLADFFRTNKITYKPVVFEKADETVAAFDSGRCDAYTNDRSGLAAERTKLKKPDDAVVLPDIISKEPLGPVVRQGDSQFFTLTKWVYFALLNLEEAGVTSANADEMAKSTNPDIKRLLGTEGEFGKGIGVANDWALQIAKKVGNYAEIYDRHFGPKTPINIARGQNELWTKGGLQYAPPIR